MCSLTNIDRLIKENKLQDALVLLNERIEKHPEDADALFVRGKVWWRLGERARATSDYAASASMNPNGAAAYALEQAREIENFFNPDLLNP